jgi:hypothetical protein
MRAFLAKAVHEGINARLLLEQIRRRGMRGFGLEG